MKSIELINLTLNEIRRSAQMVADVEADHRNLIFNMEKEGFDAERIEFNKKSADSLHEDLERCRLALRDVLDDIVECQNNHDMVAGVDAAIGQVSYDLIYERKTYEDYE
jgi:hypothetical protein